MIIKKIFKNLIFTLAIVVSLTSSVYAYIAIERKDLGFDETLAVQDQDVYAFPEKILSTKISGAPLETSSNPENWVDLLYYHFITRLKFADIPFNYLVDRDGNVYKGRSGWEGVIPELKEQEGAVLIAYVSDENDITIQAKDSLSELIEEISYTYGLGRESVRSVDIKLASRGDNELGKLVYTGSTGVFAGNVGTIADKLNFSATQHIEMSAEILDLDYPESVNAGELFDVSLKIKNSGDVPWFTFNDFIYIVTDDLNDSPFAVNGVWDSFDTPIHIEGDTIFPDSNKEVTFKMRAPLIPGQYTEVFGVKRISDTTILADSNFEVIINVDKGDLQLVKILPTGTGSLNVRVIASPGGNIVGQVAEGETLIMVEKASGWYKVKYDGENEGWVFGQYVQELE